MRRSLNVKLLLFVLCIALLVGTMATGFPFGITTAKAAGEEFAGGAGTQEDPWLISTPEQLQALNSYVGAAGSGKYFILVNDIDLAAYLSASGAGYNSGEGWMPIGNASGNFSGYLDGGGHVVKNLAINRPAADFQGLFGSLGASGSISNLGLIDAAIVARQYCGALAGRNQGMSIESVYSAASAPGEAYVTGTANVGGLIGLNQGALADCFAMGDVTGMQFVGGLVGDCESSLAPPAPILVDCFAEGDVSGMAASGTGMFIGGLAGNLNGSLTGCHASGSVEGKENTGGLVGYTATAGTVLTESYATGNVTGNGNWTGGLVGYNCAKISSCYAEGQVTGTNAVGGLVGLNYTLSATASQKGTILNSYTTGNVTGTATGMHIGGLVGNNSANSIISTAYAAGNVSGIQRVGGLVGSGNGTITNSVAANSTVTATSDVGQVIGYKPAAAAVQNCYANDSMTITASGSYFYAGTPATIAQLQTESFYTESSNWYGSGTLWDFDSAWEMPGANAFPVLQAFSKVTGASISVAPANPVDISVSPVAEITLNAVTVPDNIAQPVHYLWSLSAKPSGSGVSLGYDGANKSLVPDMAGTYTAAVSVTAYQGGMANASVTFTVVDKTALKAAITGTGSLHAESFYTAASWSNFSDKLSAAESVRGDATATQSQIDTATENLEEAIEGLRLNVNLPQTYTMYLGARVTWNPQPSGGTWRWDEAYFSAEINNGSAEFTALKAGTSTITYTVDGVPANISVTVKNSSLPLTGQDFTWVYLLSALAALLAAALGLRKRVKQA